MFRTTLILALAMYASATLSVTYTDMQEVALAMGVGFYSGVDGVFPASNGGSVGVFATHDASTGDDLSYEETDMAMLPLAAGGCKIMGLSMVGGMGAVYTGTSNEWAKADLPHPLLVSQDVKHTHSGNMWTVTGTFVGNRGSFGGVAVSADNGVSWQQVNLPEDTFYNTADIRYTSAPSPDVMYVNAGMWPQDDASKAAAGLRGVKRHHISQRLSVENGKLMLADTPPGEPVGFWAQVAKTTDGGATWSIVLDDTKSGYYPNGIDCYDVDNCAMAVEGTKDGVDFGAVMLTSDGGATWTTSDTTMAGSMMNVKMTGDSEVWSAGATAAQVGAYFQTTDLENWDAAATDPSDLIAFMTSIEFDGNGNLWGTGIKRTQLACIVKGEVA